MHARMLSFVLLFAAGAMAQQQQMALRADVVIYGGTPSGLAAAEAVVRSGASAIVVEPTSHIGGMITGGIAITDTTTPQLVGGIAAEFFNQVATEIHREHPTPAQPVLIFRGRALPWRSPAKWDLEPKIARRIFENWVRNGGYRVLLNARVANVHILHHRIHSIVLTNRAIVKGKVFIDASYEGDLMARAGVSNTYGRESEAQYGESLAGIRPPHFIRNYTEETYDSPGIEYMHHGQFGANIPARNAEGKLLWGVEPGPLGQVGASDKRIQAYCFRLIATQKSDLKVPWPRPQHYDPTHYELLLRYVQAHPGISFTRLVHLGAIPGGKFDLNASGPFSIDFIGGNYRFPDADYTERDRIIQQHADYEKGFFWFLSHDPRVPQTLREEVNSWGLARDEWTDSDHWPTQLYIRESRRLIGEYVMTQDDILVHKRKTDSIGMGSFVLDSHWVRRFENDNAFVRVEGHLDESIDLARHPYEIPYRSIVPKAQECTNLLVPVCLSATHVAICTIRMEPVYMILGHSAGVAAVLAIRSGKPVQAIDLALFTQALRQQGQVLHEEDRREP